MNFKVPLAPFTKNADGLGFQCSGGLYDWIDLVDTLEYYLDVDIAPARAAYNQPDYHFGTHAGPNTVLGQPLSVVLPALPSLSEWRETLACLGHDEISGEQRELLDTVFEAALLPLKRTVVLEAFELNRLSIIYGEKFAATWFLARNRKLQSAVSSNLITRPAQQEARRTLRNEILRLRSRQLRAPPFRLRRVDSKGC